MRDKGVYDLYKRVQNTYSTLPYINKNSSSPKRTYGSGLRSDAPLNYYSGGAWLDSRWRNRMLQLRL
jgi:hypothetical protein